MKTNEFNQRSFTVTPLHSTGVVGVKVFFDVAHIYAMGDIIKAIDAVVDNENNQVKDVFVAGDILIKVRTFLTKLTADIQLPASAFEELFISPGPAKDDDRTLHGR